MANRRCVFSPDRLYRYTLWRQWADCMSGGYCMFVGLNPSTADDEQDDPTIRRCIAFAKAWGYAGMCMTNAFAFRATDPRVMMREPAPIGRDNDKWLRLIAEHCAVSVAAWGTKGVHRGRDILVRRMLPQLRVLRLTKRGNPEHPLYLPKTLVPMEWPK